MRGDLPNIFSFLRCTQATCFLCMLLVHSSVRPLNIFCPFLCAKGNTIEHSLQERGSKLLHSVLSQLPRDELIFRWQCYT